jgi:hypothetical protein
MAEGRKIKDRNLSPTASLKVLQNQRREKVTEI